MLYHDFIHSIASPEQLAAVDSPSDSLLLIAGAGTGKSTVLVERAARLVLGGGINPRSVMIATFSREAAESLRHRLAERHPDLARCPVGTFHSLAFDLMPRKPIVLDEETTIERLASYSTLHKGKAATLDDLSRRTNHPAVSQFVSRMNVNGEMDYTGLLCWLRDNTETVFIQHLLVDEAQDNDQIQWDIVRKFAASGAHIFCVMDPRQQIYQWRGATYEPGMKLKDHLFLTQSFRLKPQIAELNNQLADYGCPDVWLKPIVGVRLGDAIKKARGILDIPVNDNRSRAILCRTNRTVDAVSAELSRIQVEHSVKRRVSKSLPSFINYLASGGNPPDVVSRLLYPDLSGAPSLAGLKLAMLKQQYTDAEELLRSIHFDSRNLQEELQWWIKLARNYSTIEEVAQRGSLFPMETEATSGIVVSTIHQAKGLEYDVVLVPPEDYVGSREEHHRLSLVQVTRAKESLLVCGSEGHLCRMVDKLLSE